MLSHTSGIKESLFTDPGILMGSMLEPAKIWQPSAVATVLARSARSRAATQPTTAPHAFTYANDNYILLGLIAEQVGGRPLAAQLAAEFFTPLGMTETTLLPWHPGSSVSPVAGYDEYLPFGPTLIEKTTTSWDSLTWAAGSLCSSSRDLLLWLDALFHNQVLKPETLAHMTDWTDARDNGRDNHMVQYGLGISRYELAGHSLLGHPGGGFGGECFPFWDPASDTAWVVVYNLSRKDNPAGTTLLARLLDSQPPK